MDARVSWADNSGVGRRFDRLSAIIVAFALVVVGAMWAAVEFQIAGERETKIDEAKRHNANLARAFDEHTVRTLDYVDEILMAIERRFEREGAALDLETFFRELKVNSKIVRNSVITDAQGRIILGSHGAPTVSLADREHINVHFSKDIGHAFIGKPVQARVNGQWSVVFSRRANAPDGSLLGVVALAIDPFYFSDFYKDIALGPDRFVGIVGLDGIIRSRLSDGDPGLGIDVSKGEILARWANARTDAFVFDSILDGIRRVLAYRTLKDFPLLVYVATSLDWELAKTQERARNYRLTASVASAVIALFAAGFIFFGLRRQAEARLRREKENLELAVTARTAELREQQKALVETNARLGAQAIELERSNVRHAAEREAATKANRAKSDFLSNMSHELRTPLNAIIGFSQLMATDDKFDAGHRDGAELIHKSGRHLLDLVNDILDLAKIDDRKIELSIETVDCTDLVDDSLSMIRAVAAMRGVSIAVGHLGGLAMRGDRTRLRQILINFLSNAVKYNKQNGHVVVDAVRGPGKSVRLRVRDTGPGIDSARMAELFKPFNRLGAEATGVEGSGIGLALSRRLAEAMGGTVGVESETGKGSLFWVEMPEGDALAPPSPAHAVGRDDAGHDGATTRTVVYIEDNPSNVLLVERILRRLPRVKLISAHRPGLGIDLVKAHKPALVLLDLNMPDMDGFEVLNMLKSSAETRAIPVIAVTAAAMARDLEKGRQAGFADYLTKPLDVDRFLATVRRHLAVDVV